MVSANAIVPDALGSVYVLLVVNIEFVKLADIMADLYEENPLPSVQDISYRLPERSVEEIQDFFDNFDEYITEISAYQIKIKKLLQKHFCFLQKEQH